MARWSRDERLTRELAYQQGLSCCAECNEYKTIDQFCKNRARWHGLQRYCKSCMKKREQEGEASGKWNRRNMQRTISERYKTLAGAKCQRCGYDRLGILEFHHVDPNGKEREPTSALHGRTEAAMTELDKCALLCPNCHRELHFGVWHEEFAKRDGLGWTVKQNGENAR